MICYQAISLRTAHIPIRGRGEVDLIYLHHSCVQPTVWMLPKLVTLCRLWVARQGRDSDGPLVELEGWPVCVGIRGRPGFSEGPSEGVDTGNFEGRQQGEILEVCFQRLSVCSAEGFFDVTLANVLDLSWYCRTCWSCLSPDAE